MRFHNLRVKPNKTLQLDVRNYPHILAHPALFDTKKICQFPGVYKALVHLWGSYKLLSD